MTRARSITDQPFRQPGEIPATVCAFPDCEVTPTKMWDFPICDRHVFTICSMVSRSAHWVEKLHTPIARLPRPEGAKRHPAIVYFLRFGDRIKIGTTTHLQARLEVVPHDEVLVTLPGGHAVESAEHRRFAHLRITGEWFRAEPELLDYIKQIRQQIDQEA